MVLISWGMEGVGKQVKLNKRGDCNKQREGAQQLYFINKRAHIRNLFLFLVMCSIAIEEGNKLQNLCDVLIVVIKRNKFGNENATV